MLGGRIHPVWPAVLAPWGPGRWVPTGGTPPPPDPAIDPRGSGEERLGITSWGPVRCEPPDGSPPLPDPVISPRGPGEERAGTSRWEPGQCETTGSSTRHRRGGAAWSSLLGRQFLDGLASPKLLSPEASSSKGDSAESDPIPSGEGSTVSLGRSRAARGCPSSAGGEAAEGTRAGALWIRGCLDSQASARSHSVGAQAVQTVQGDSREHARCRGHCWCVSQSGTPLQQVRHRHFIL